MSLVLLFIMYISFILLDKSKYLLNETVLSHAVAANNCKTILLNLILYNQQPIIFFFFP